jgi:hypothetical protein
MMVEIAANQMWYLIIVLNASVTSQRLAISLKLQNVK